MKKFQFHLNTVLSYKQQVLDSKMDEYGIAVDNSNRQVQLIESIKQRFAEVGEEFRTKKLEGITVLDALKYENCLEALTIQIKREKEKLVQLREFEEQKRLEVVEARKETASLEKLRDIKKKEYDAAEQKAEEKMIDDLIAARANANAG